MDVALCWDRFGGMNERSIGDKRQELEVIETLPLTYPIAVRPVL